MRFHKFLNFDKNRKTSFLYQGFKKRELIFVIMNGLLGTTKKSMGELSGHAIKRSDHNTIIYGFGDIDEKFIKK
jgi:hypothetical protein